MKKVYLVHCWGGKIEDGWYPWLCKHLKNNNIEVHALVMPNTEEPVIEKWVKALEENVEVLNEEVYFIGHSIGCQTIMRYLQKKKITQIGGILFVAPWVELSLKAIETEEDYRIAVSWLNEPLYFSKMRKFTENIFCIFSDNDYFVPFSQKKFFENKLNANTFVLHEKGHISAEDEIFELPEILNVSGKLLGLEFLEIVDKNGNFTGEILERDIAHNENLLHNEISVFLVNDKSEVLLQKRSPNKKYSPNKWGLCAGHVDAYESLESAAVREIFEEVGVKIKESDLHFLGRVLFEKNMNSHFTYLYFVRINLNFKDFVIQTEELSKVQWVPILEVRKWVEEGFTSFDTSYLPYLENLKKKIESE